MSAVSHPRVATVPFASHWAWLAGGFVVAFAIPFLLADVLELDRDVFYGLYAISVLGLIGLWARSTGYDLGAAVRRRWPLAVGLGAACAGVMALMVVRTEDATTRPDGIELAGAVLWRGVVYGISDGLLLSVFPILVVFAALAGSRLNDRVGGKVVIGAIALLASLAMTAVYHLGYSDFRSDKVARPLAGDVIWSVPTLVTLNPIGAPIAHVGLHVSAVLHSYDTDTFLPPHVSAALPRSVGSGRVAADSRRARLRGRADRARGNGVREQPRRQLDGGGRARRRRHRGGDDARCADAARERQQDLDRCRHPSARTGRPASPQRHRREWLPGLLPYGDRITIAQLLTHTSGLIDNNDMAARPAAFIARVGDPVLRAQLTRVATRARTERAIEYSPKLWIKLASWQPLRSTPGTTFHYSNIGFEILGLIATQAAGQDLPSLYREVIVAPLALESAAYDPQGPISGPHARGYLVAPSTGALTDATDWHGGIGAEGGIVANAAETGRFLSGLMQGEVLDAGWVARMKAGLFWTAPEPGACGNAFGHSGAGAGFKTDVLVSADGKRVAVLLMNGRAGSAGDEQAHRAIWQLYCGGVTGRWRSRPQSPAGRRRRWPSCRRGRTCSPSRLRRSSSSLHAAVDSFIATEPGTAPVTTCFAARRRSPSLRSRPPSIRVFPREAARHSRSCSVRSRSKGKRWPSRMPGQSGPVARTGEGSSCPVGVLLVGSASTLLWHSRKAGRLRYLRRAASRPQPCWRRTGSSSRSRSRFSPPTARVRTSRPPTSGAPTRSYHQNQRRPRPRGLVRAFAERRRGHLVPDPQGKLPQARMLVRHGYGVLLLDARGYDGSEGDPNLFGWAGAGDIDAAVAWLQRRADVTGDRIGGIGFSVGGEMMLQAAASNTGLRAVVSEGAGVRSIREDIIRGPRGWLALPESAVQTAAVAVLERDDSAAIAAGSRPTHLAASAPPRLRRSWWRRRGAERRLLPRRPRPEGGLEDRRSRARWRLPGTSACVRGARHALLRPSAARTEATGLMASPAVTGIDLYWLPLGAGGRSVRVNGKVFEAVAARLERRDRYDLYHSALQVRVPEGRYVIEQAPAWSDGAERGVVAEGSVGPAWRAASASSATRFAAGVTGSSPTSPRRSRAPTG